MTHDEIAQRSNATRASTTLWTTIPPKWQCGCRCLRDSCIFQAKACASCRESSNGSLRLPLSGNRAPRETENRVLIARSLHALFEKNCAIAHSLGQNPKGISKSHIPPVVGAVLLCVNTDGGPATTPISVTVDFSMTDCVSAAGRATGTGISADDQSSITAIFAPAQMH